MKYKVLRGFCLGGGKDAFPVDELELKPEIASLYLRQGRVAEISAAGPTNVGKAALLASISLAGSVDELNELVAEDEADPEIVEAYEAKALEFEA